MADAEEPQAGYLHVLLPRAPVHARRVPRPLTRPAPTLAEIDVPGPPGAWSALGFAVGADAACDVGTTRVRLGAPALGWALRDGPAGPIDGLPTRAVTGAPPAPAPPHPNGVAGVDHVVATTPDFDRTIRAAEAAGLTLRRVRETGGDKRQGFFVVGDALLEVVGPARADGSGPARFWGVTLVVADLDATATRLGDALGAPRDAVQAGRRIATVHREAGLGTAVALMTPRR